MRSKKIKIRNLSVNRNQIDRTIHVKPTVFLIIAFLAGLAMVVLRAYTMGAGIGLMLMSSFALIVMPDRILLQFTKDYLILYNSADRSECTLVYWDEIVSWQYEYHRNYDLVLFILVDGSTERQEVYSKFFLKKYIESYIPHKEVKNKRIKKVKR